MPLHRTQGLFKGTKAYPAPLSMDQEKTCGAMCKSRRARYDLKWRQKLCKNPVVPGRTRCRFHGGLSTGAKTREGKARSIAAMIEGRKLWINGRRIEK